MRAKVLRRIHNAGGAGRSGAIAKSRQERRALKALVAAGTIDKIAPGWYSLPDTPAPLQLALLANGRLTCLSALHIAGLRTLNEPKKVHLAFNSNHQPHLPRHLADLAVIHREPDHWSAVQPPSIITDYGEVSAIAPWPAVFARAAICLPLREAVVALDAGLERNLARKFEILELLSPTHHQTAIESVGLARPTSQSVLESIARLELVTHGFRVEAQKFIPDVGRIDLLVEGWIVIELDGFSYHHKASQFYRDRERDRALTLAGMTVLRYTYREVVENPSLITQEVSALLRKRSGTALAS